MIALSALRSNFERLEDPNPILALLPQGAYIRHLLEGMTQQWWVHQGDLVIPDNLDADLMLIVTGDLIVHGTFDDYLSSTGHLLVQGKFAARHAHSWGTLHVRGNADVEGIFYADYNDYVLYVEGTTSARCFMVADHDCHVRLADKVPRMDWDEGVSAHDMQALFSDAACVALDIPDDDEIIELPEWSLFAELIKSGTPIWHDEKTG